MARPLPRSGYAILLATVLFAFAPARADILTLAGPTTNVVSIRSDNPALVGGAGQLIVGQFAGGDRRGRALFNFDLSGIPAGALISSVSLVLTLDSQDGGGSIAGAVPLQLFQLTGGSFSEADGNWAKRDSANPWTTPGGDFSSTLLSAASADPTSVTPAPVTFASTPEFVAAVGNNAGGSISFLLKLNATDEATITSRRTFFIASDDTANAGRAPVFSVEYTIPEPGSSLLLLVSVALAQTARWRRR